MAKTKEIRNKIAIIKKTQKITKTMQMVAASKMRKTEQRMKASLPYAKKIMEVVSHVAAANSEHKHHYLDKRDKVERVGFIIISTDRGLCGALNANLFKMLVNNFREWQQKGASISVCLIGQKAAGFFKHLPINILATTSHLNGNPQISDLIGAVKVITDAYDRGEIDRLFLANNEFISTMQQKPGITQLLPLTIENGSNHDDDSKKTIKKTDSSWDYIYEPNNMKILEVLFTRYLEMEVYQAVVDNIACEQAARMVAMQSASDNAAELIEEFQLAYNKARQSAITQELAEIVGGADAV
jgi:F-type H+-transporting ATPase subunit gamma